MSSEVDRGARYVPYEARLHDGAWKLTVRVPIDFTLARAAQALAVVSPTKPRRVGAKSCRRLLQRAGRRWLSYRLTEHQLKHADPIMVAFYRDTLIASMLFPAEPDPHGPPAVLTVRVPVTFTLTEAAQALTVISPSKPPHFGAKSCRRLLQVAGRKRLARNLNKPKLDRADPATVAFYRDSLIGFGLFPAEAGE